MSQALTEAAGKLECLAVGYKPYHVTCAVQNRRAVRTNFKMGFHAVTEFGVYVSVQIIGDFPPDVLAADLNKMLHFSPAYNVFPRGSRTRRSLGLRHRASANAHA